MSLIRKVVLSGLALTAVTAVASAGETTLPVADTLDVGKLAADAAPVLPPGDPVVISKGVQPEVPGLPLSSRDRAAFGDTAHTIGVLPMSDAAKGPSVSWSGYAQTGVIYKGTK